MKKFKYYLGLVVVLIMVFALCLTFVACENKDNNQNPSGPEDNGDPDPVVRITISMTADKNILEKGETATFTVTVSDASAYTLSLNNTAIATLNGDVLTAGEVGIDTYVTVTATANSNPNVNTSKTILIKAEVEEGEVEELTSAMLQYIGNASITVTGTVTDYYEDFNLSSNSSENSYSFEVKMSDGKWNGWWNSDENEENVIIDYYRRGTADGVKDANGNSGNPLMKLYINKDNELTEKAVTDYQSISAVWQGQHLWNHLSNLAISKFTYDSKTGYYKFNLDYKNEDDLYLMTYISYSMTPMLTDTLDQFYLKVEEGEITEILAQTEVLYQGADTREDADAMSYTKVVFYLSDIGTTVVDDPAPYGELENGEILVTALQTIFNARNYHFVTVDTTTYAPTGDESDYDLSDAADGNRPHNYTSSTGTVGTEGWITEDGALIAETGKYSYTMDGKAYHTEYTGYKQNENGTYEEFAFNAQAYTIGTDPDTSKPIYRYAMEGKKLYYGNMFDSLPTFDFSPNVLELDTAVTSKGKTVYTFVVNDSTITRELALEVALYKQAKDAATSTSNKFTIVVDSNGKLLKTIIPYSISGIYVGYYTTTYSDIGTTELPEGTFDYYKSRVIPTDWAEMTVSDYYYLHSTLCSAYGCRDEKTGEYDHSAHTATGDVVLKAIVGEDALDDVPAPSIFVEIFGDNLYGPWFDYDNKGTDENPNYIEHFDFNISSDVFDENYQLVGDDFQGVYDKLVEVMTREGYTLSVANTDITGGETGRKTRYITFIKGDVLIVFENIYTRYFYGSIYKVGDWTLNR